MRSRYSLVLEKGGFGGGGLVNGWAVFGGGGGVGQLMGVSVQCAM